MSGYNFQILKEFSFTKYTNMIKHNVYSKHFADFSSFNVKVTGQNESYH